MPLYAKLDLVVGDGFGEMKLEKLIQDARFRHKVKRIVPVYVEGRRKRFSPRRRLELIEEEIRKFLEDGKKVMIQANCMAIHIYIIIPEF